MTIWHIGCACANCFSPDRSAVSGDAMLSSELGTDMQRREFITLVAAALAQPVGEKPPGRTAPSYEIDLESGSVASGSGVAVV
jgi:hypothetical protein